jgi:methylmalonic aciduria homocystinuria type C protein
MVCAMRPALEPAIARAAAAGFDLAQTFDAAQVAGEPGLEMLASPARLGVLIGNTRALWPTFSAALAEPALAGAAHPLDTYTERTLDAAFAGAQIWYGHREYAGNFVPLGRLAAAIGVGALAPNHLLVHPTFGPWLALRAVILLAGPPPPRRLAIAQPCQCDAGCASALARAHASMTWLDWLAVRDACSLRAHRYSEPQIAYHYARSRLR